MSNRSIRMRNALQAAFIADALAAPAHWYYGRESIFKQFGESGVDRYFDAPHPHPEAFMIGMSYKPDVEKAKSLGRKYDILGRHAKFYRTSFSEFKFDTSHQEEEHGNKTTAKEERYHYHTGLKAGELTVAAELQRVLLRSVAEHEQYLEDAFLESFVAFLTSSDIKDAYREVYLRRWFENYSQGIDISRCADKQRINWSIGSMGGVARPLLLSMLAKTPYLGLGFAVEHQQLTHNSPNISGALGFLVPLLHDLLDGKDPMEAVRRHTKTLRLPKVTGTEMLEAYRSHDGPGNIDGVTMWNMHTELSDEAFDIDELIKLDEQEAIDLIGAACYTERGVPLVLYFAAKHNFDLEKALVANVNAGGDNVHRNAILGILCGAATDGDLPKALVDGLVDQVELSKEIADFVSIAAQNDPPQNLFGKTTGNEKTL